MFAACRPFGATLHFDSDSLALLPSSEAVHLESRCECANRSSPPSVGVMKRAFVSRWNHLDGTVAIYFFLLLKVADKSGR